MFDGMFIVTLMYGFFLFVIKDDFLRIDIERNIYTVGFSVLLLIGFLWRLYKIWKDQEMAKLDKFEEIVFGVIGLYLVITYIFDYSIPLNAFTYAIGIGLLLFMILMPVIKKWVKKKGIS